MSAPRKRCGVCEKSKPEQDTTLVGGMRSGNYRTAGGSSGRRVCRTCTEEAVRYTERMQAENRRTPLDDYYVKWSEACDAFGIDRTHLWTTDYDRDRHRERLASFTALDESIPELDRDDWNTDVREALMGDVPELDDPLLPELAEQLVAALTELSPVNRWTMRVAHELCPVHGWDDAICADDEDATCAHLR